MDFALTADQEAIREAVGSICSRFGDDYWLERDRKGGFPDAFYRAMAEAGWSSGSLLSALPAGSPVAGTTASAACAVAGGAGGDAGTAPGSAGGAESDESAGGSSGERDADMCLRPS